MWQFLFSPILIYLWTIKFLLPQRLILFQLRIFEILQNYINTKLDVFNPESRIRNRDDLRKTFNRNEISPRDKVDFIL